MNIDDLVDFLELRVKSLMKGECAHLANGKPYTVKAVRMLPPHAEAWAISAEQLEKDPVAIVHITFPTWFKGTSTPCCTTKFAISVSESESFDSMIDVIHLRLNEAMLDLRSLSPA